MYKINFDSDGLIVQTNGDGGDCAARSGLLTMGLKLRELMGISNADWPVTASEYWARCRKLFTADFALYRYPMPPYNDLHDVTADQVMPMIMAAYIMGENTTAALIAHANIHDFRFPNGDLCGPADYMIAHNTSTFLGRAQLYFGTLLRCNQAEKHGDDVGDDIRLFQTLAFLNWRDGKPPAALPMYYRRRPCYSFIGQTYDDRAVDKYYLKVPGCGVQYAFDHYFDPITNANPLNELWRPIIEKLSKY